MPEHFEGQWASKEQLREEAIKRYCQEFDPQIDRLYDRIISHLTKHGLAEGAELSQLEREGADLERRADDKASEEKSSYKQHFSDQIHLGYDWLKAHRSGEQGRRHEEEVGRILSQQPTNEMLRTMVQGLERQAKPWRALHDAVVSSGRITYANPILAAVEERQTEASGLASKLEKARINTALDSRYPNAESKTIVEFEGSRYQIRYVPLDESQSGKTVYGWDHSWVPYEEPIKKSAANKKPKK
jgi:murein tripeptide amidase MpaA